MTTARAYRATSNRTCANPACRGWIRIGDYILVRGDVVTHAICAGEVEIANEGYPWEPRR